MRSTPPPPIVDAGLLLRRMLLRAADALLPPFAVVWERSMGLARVHAMTALVELGAIDRLAQEPRTVAELAIDLGADEDALGRVLRVAQLDGLVRRDRRGRLRLTRVGGALRADRPASLAPWVRYQALDSTRRAWEALPVTVRTGVPGFRVAHGTTVWDHYAAHPDQERAFADAMRSLTAWDAADVAAASVWPDSGTVCDVAGGTGALLSAILAPRPALRGVLVEAPGVLAEARKRGIDRRIELVAGDLREPLTATADVYVLKNIVHDWDDATNVAMLTNVGAAMAAGARVVLIEQEQPEDRPHPTASLTDLQMLTQCEGGRERSRAQLQGLLRRAGLRPGRVERVGVSVLVEGVKP